MRKITILFTSLLLISICYSQDNKEDSKKQSTYYLYKNKKEMSTATEKQAIEKVLSSYGNAISESNTVDLVSLYSKDGVLMPNGAPSLKGQEQLKTAYENLFKAFELSVQYTVDEITLNRDYAYVRTNSKGTTLIRSKSETIPVNNKELFVLHKENDQWRIAVYIFNNNQMK